MKILEKYKINLDFISADVEIVDRGDFVNYYEIKLPKLERGTEILKEEIKEKLISKIPIRENLDKEAYEKLKNEIFLQAKEEIKKLIKIKESDANYLANLITIEMIGSGIIDLLIEDPNLEEIAINNSKEPIWVYHKKFGWLKTNIYLKNEQEIYNIASIIGRRVGRQINILNPLMDAYLLSGDRVNATLYPISSFGNTITIRKFRRNPWTVIDFINNKTISLDAAAFLWQSVQYELNIIIAGGTGSGKTSLLNVILEFIPPNQRIVSIEDTRELSISSFHHWVPLVTRAAGAEGKGEIKMLDLLVNSLRMRPDRIVVGEIRRAEEAEVLFEAMHTGHSVYATLHAETAEQAYRRLTHEPINVPETLMESLHLFAVMFRERRKGIRRLLQISEVVPFLPQKVNDLYRWDAKIDEIKKANESLRIHEELELFTGLSKKEQLDDLEEKKKILKWMIENDLNGTENIGKIIALYYRNREEVLNALNNKKSPKIFL
ncbi:MAG: ATPase, T2SS/T4P/T4SS family [Candidatus Aenigmatarchaeota archaeon]